MGMVSGNTFTFLLLPRGQHISGRPASRTHHTWPVTHTSHVTRHPHTSHVTRHTEPTLRMFFTLLVCIACIGVVTLGTVRRVPLQRKDSAVCLVCWDDVRIRALTLPLTLSILRHNGACPHRTCRPQWS